MIVLLRSRRCIDQAAAWIECAFLIPSIRDSNGQDSAHPYYILSEELNADGTTYLLLYSGILCPGIIHETHVHQSRAGLASQCRK